VERQRGGLRAKQPLDFCWFGACMGSRPGLCFVGGDIEALKRAEKDWMDR
jgi:hypothetical protein